MQKHIYLSVFLGLIFNTFFFAQTEIEVEVEEANSDGVTEITIERTVIDDEGNETKYVIKKVGEDAKIVLSDELIQQYAGNHFTMDSDVEKDIEKRVYVVRSHDDKNDHRLHLVSAGHSKPKVRMGVELENHEQGVLISYVSGNSAAQEAGLREGDVITLLDNEPIKSYQELKEILTNKEVGDELLVTYLRDDEEHSAALTLKENMSHSNFANHCKYLEKPCLGVNYNSWNEGISVTGIFDDSGAEEAGLKKGDKILKINDASYTFGSQFDKAIKAQKPGSMIKIDYQRGGENFTTEAEIGVWDECGVCRLLSNQKEETENITVPLAELSLKAYDMYPVPARDQITVSFIADQAPLEVSFYDVNGKVIDQEIINDFSGSFSKTYNLENVAKGLAIITITQNGKSTTKQALIQ